jgi:hypothetical protein
MESGFLRKVEKWLRDKSFCKKSGSVWKWFYEKSGSVREVVPYVVILYEKFPYEQWFCKKSDYM